MFAALSDGYGNLDQKINTFFALAPVVNLKMTTSTINTGCNKKKRKNLWVQFSPCNNWNQCPRLFPQLLLLLHGWGKGKILQTAVVEILQTASV